MAIEKQETNESQIGLTLFSKKRQYKTDDDKHCFLYSPTLNSLGLPQSTDGITIIDDEEKVTLEPKKKKPRRLGSWWNNVEPFDELICVVKGSPEANEDNDVVSSADLCIPSTDLHETKTTNKKNDDERSLPKTKNDDERSLPKTKKKDESVSESTTTRKENYEHVTLEDLGFTVEDFKDIPWEAFDPAWEIKSDPWLLDDGYLEDFYSMI